MRQNNRFAQAVMALALAGITCLSCRKQDILPEPVGEPIPYKGADKTWQQLLDASPYTFFQTAWKRSNMGDIIKKDAAAFYTFFVPSDKAFQDAGWTLDKIKTVPVAQLDTLLSNYTVSGIFKPVIFETITGSQALRTLARRNDLPNYQFSGKFYTTFLFTAKHGDSLYVNGMGMNKWGTGKEGTNGMIYPIEKLITRPEKTMWEYLTEDPRFSLFTDAVLINDSLYQSDWRSVNPINILQSGPDYPQFTLFAPTNDAFKKIGIQTTDDVRDYCMRVWPLPQPDYDPDFFYQDPITSLDSILFPHGLEMYRYYTGQGTGPVFFTNDFLDNGPVLSNIMLAAGQKYSSPPLYLRIAFSKQNEEPLVKRFGNKGNAMQLKEKNIRVTNGVIHIVDELFLP
ncbi:MAG: fasciclin domain-containing protein [Filimonas sp.]|nr:fasciclin domain-containing protein [Filimonas sp.]